MGLPPFDSGALKVTVALFQPGVAVPIAGAPGAMIGVTELEAADGGLVPFPFAAVTVNV
jgi:hypothetical protein